MNQIDLHMHTNVSNDGDYAPETLIQMCYEHGLTTVAIADHNSTRAYPRAQAKARALGVTLIPAVELDCHLHGVNLHILGYGIDPTDPAFAEYEADLIRQEQKASAVRVQAVRSLGIVVAEEQIQALAIDGVITGEMIAEVALQDSRNDEHPLLAPYRAGGTRGNNPYVNFYWDVCSQGKLAYAPVDFLTLAQGIAMIQKAGGFAVLAHPGINIGKNAALFQEIIASGVRGVEVYSSYHDADSVQFYRQQAQEQQVLMTIGSDFHGKTKPSIHLGSFAIPDEPEIHRAFLNRVET